MTNRDSLGKLSDYDAAELKALGEEFPGWVFWVVHGASRDWWCARREIVETAEVHGDNPKHLREHIAMKLADWAIDAKDAPDHI